MYAAPSRPGRDDRPLDLARPAHFAPDRPAAGAEDLSVAASVQPERSVLLTALRDRTEKGRRT